MAPGVRGFRRSYRSIEAVVVRAVRGFRRSCRGLRSRCGFR